MSKIARKSNRVRRSVNWRHLATVILGLIIVVALLNSIISSFSSGSSVASKTESQYESKVEEIAVNTNQRDAIRALIDFHDGITKKNYHRAYECLSQEFQSSLQFDGWAKGFKTTVSSTVSNVRITSETSRRIVLSYDLEAVDEPGGKSRFRGVAIVIKTSNGWKINEIMNTVIS